MPDTQKKTSHVKAIAFVDYKPAELRINKQWIILYYAKHPVTKQFERFRLSVPVIKSRTERLKHGKKIVLELNKKLEAGWLPYYNPVGVNEFKTFEYCQEKFLDQLTEEIEKKEKRPDTLRAYKSYFSMINKYVADKKLNLKLVLEFNSAFVINYLDWIYFERKNTGRTYNNHLAFISNFINFCIRRGYLKENFTTSIQRKKKEQKTRQVLTPTVKEKLKELEKENPGYFTLCMATYFCFIRRKELTMLQVKHIHLKEGYIFIPKEISKNGKDESVTIPIAYAIMIANHVKNATNEDLIFSIDNFKPGIKQMMPKKISDTWTRFRNKKSIPEQFQFYSLKDSGITDLLNSGIPAIKVRDQARHYDLKITESYTSRNRTCDESVRNSNFSF